MALSGQRARLSTTDLERWQHAIGQLLASDPELAEASRDPRRNHNQDETAIAGGEEHQRVLCPKGLQKVLYNVGGSSRDHFTLSMIVNAAGECSSARVVFPGTYVNVPKKKLKDLPTTGIHALSDKFLK